MSNIAERISFWTPVLGNGWFLDGIEGLFSGNACPCDGTDSEVVVIDPDTSIARMDGKSSSWEGCILKIVFFTTLLLPLIALIIKGIYRSQVTITFQAPATETQPQEEVLLHSPPLPSAPNRQESFNHLVDQMVMRVGNRLSALFSSLNVAIIPGLFGAYPNHKFIKTTQYKEDDGIKWTFSDSIFNLHLRAKDVEGAFISIELDYSAEHIDSQVIASVLNHLMVVKSSLQSIFIPGEIGTTILSDFCDLLNRPNAPTLPRCGREKRLAPQMVNHAAAIAAFLILGNTPIDSASDSALMSLCGPTPQNKPYTAEQLSLARTLIQKGANLNVSMIENTLIQAAIARGSKELVELCLDSQTILPDSQGKTPFHYALFPKPNHEILKILTTHARQWIDTADQDGTTPLQLAIMNRDLAGAKLLIKAGATIDPTIDPLIQAATRANRTYF